jgi:hypothetical protein
MLLVLLVGGCEVVVGATRDSALREARPAEAGPLDRARTEPPPQDLGTCQAEVCNGKDDDCDGVADEGSLCPTGQACAAGVCVASPRPCSSSADCTLAGQSCVAGACSPAPCGEAKDCPSASQNCVANLCSPKSCANNLQCGMSQTCVSGLCSPKECTSDTDCSGGLCLGGSCPRRCATDADCDAVEHCQGGFCR